MFRRLIIWRKKTDTKTKITLYKNACTAFKLRLCLCQIEREALVLVVCIFLDFQASCQPKFQSSLAISGFFKTTGEMLNSCPATWPQQQFPRPFHSLITAATNGHSGIENVKQNK
jgi:hypothetical protein